MEVGIEEIDRLGQHDAGDATVRLAQDAWPDADILHLAAEHFFRGRERLTAFHRLDDVGVTRFGELALLPFMGHKQRVAINPCVVALRFRDLEAAIVKRAGARVELTHDRGVLATVGQFHQAVAILWRQASRAVPDPVRLFSFCQGVKVENRAPLRFARAVALHRGGAPDAAHVVGVLPEIAERAVAGKGDGGDAIARRDDFRGVGVDSLEAGIVLKLRQRTRVLGPCPRQRLCSFDLLHPDIRIVLRGCRQQRGTANEGEKNAQLHRFPSWAFLGLRPWPLGLTWVASRLGPDRHRAADRSSS
jgi:hypothetical protein